MLPNEINTKIAAKGYPATLIAEALKVKPASVSAVINNTSDSKRIAKAIAVTLDMKIEEVFPDKPQYHHSSFIIYINTWHNFFLCWF